MSLLETRNPLAVGPSPWIDGCALPIDMWGPTQRSFVPFDSGLLSLPLGDLFSGVAARHGDRPAVVDAHGSVDYRSLADRVAQLAARLAAETPPGAVIGVLLPSSVDFTTAMLACLKVGRIFVPIDLHYPAAWIAQVLTDAAMTHVVTRGELAPSTALPAGIAAIDLDTVREGETLASAAIAVDPDAPAVILYTSGSTGRPKGIVNSQRALLRRVEQYVNAAHVGPEDRFLPLSSECTIAGLRERLTALLSGATLFLTSVQDSGAARIATLLRTAEITMIYAVPALLRALIHLEDFAAPSSLRVVRVGGEAVLWSDIALLRGWLPESCLIELGYSSTEAPIMQWFVPRDFPQEGARVPIGYPLAGNQIAILDDDGAPVPDGALGELVLRSPFIALGRWVDGVCIGDDYPSDPNLPGARIQRTGDLVRRRPDGLIDLIGRKDRQIKIRGQRVEPAELESCLRAWPGVREAAVIAREGTAATGEPDLALVAYIETADHFPGDAIDRLRQHLRETLPAPLQPAHLYAIAALPRLPSSKIDLKGLQALDREQSREATFPEARGDSAAPRTLTELVLHEVWSEALGHPMIPRDSDFFDLGGNSLAAIRLFHDIERRLELSLPVTVIYQAPTIARLATVIDEKRDTSYSPLVAIREGGDGPPFFMIHGVGGNVMELVPIGRRIRHAGPVYAVQALGLDGRRPPLNRIRAMSESYLQAIRQIQPRGPYLLAGYSYGGLVAFDLACLLHEQGEAIDLLMLIDSTTNPRQWPLAVWLEALGRRFRNHAAAMRGLGLSDRLGLVARAGLAGLKRVRWRLGLGRADQSPLAIDALPPALQATRQGFIEAAARYRPSRYPGTVTLVVAEIADEYGCDPRAIWTANAGELVVKYVPGDHSTMIEGDNGDILSALISDQLARVAARP